MAIGVTAKHFGSAKLKDFLQSKGKGVAGVVHVSLEGHAENAHSVLMQGLLAEETLNDESRIAFIDVHGRLAKKELIPIEGKQLDGVFEQTWAGGKTSFREEFVALVSFRHGMVNAVVIAAVGFGNHGKLIAGGKLDKRHALEKSFASSAS